MGRAILSSRDDSPRRLDFTALAAISDAFFPRILVRRRRLAPMGFHADAALLAAQGERRLLGTPAR